MAQKKPFLIRIDPKLLDHLQRWANDEFRSVNGHIEYLLRSALMKAGRLKKNDD
ncbi:MAG: toxin-antitoxin system HicB family antitoxin [Candidatus Zixiibacteriota bacterium]